MKCNKSEACFQRHNSLWCRETSKCDSSKAASSFGGGAGEGLTRGTQTLPSIPPSITTDNDWSLWGNAARNEPSWKSSLEPYLSSFYVCVCEGWGGVYRGHGLRPHKNSARPREWGGDEWCFLVGRWGKSWKQVYSPIVWLWRLYACLRLCVCVCVGGGIIASVGTSAAFFIHKQKKKKRLHHKVTLTTPADHRAHPSISITPPLIPSGRIFREGKQAHKHKLPIVYKNTDTVINRGLPLKKINKTDITLWPVSTLCN